MSVYLDYNSKYTSNVFNLKDSYLYSSGVLKHIPLNSLNSFISPTSNYSLGSTSLPALNNGVVIINGLVTVFDSTTPLLTGSCPTNAPIALGITTQSNVPYFSLYPFGVLPSSYVKVATFIQGTNDWVYEPVLGPTSNLLTNSFGYKNDNHVISTSTMSIPMLGNQGFIFSDSNFILSSTNPDLRCGISVTSSYPVISGSGQTFSYTTQLVLDPFLKTFVNVPTRVDRSSIQQITLTLTNLYASSYVQTIPGVMITSGGINQESFIAAYSATSTGTNYGVVAVSFANGTASTITGTPTFIVTDNVTPVLLPSFSSNGNKFIYVNGGNTFAYNVNLSASGTLHLTSMGTVVPAGTCTADNISGATLGSMSFALAQNTTSGTIAIAPVTSQVDVLSLWPPVTFSSTSITSTAKLLIDTHAIAHVLFLSGTSLMSYDYPLGSGAPSGAYSTLFTGAHYFNVTQNLFGDSLVVVSTSSTAYKSINYGPWTNIGGGVNFGATNYMQLNSDLSYFQLAISGSQIATFQIGLDGLEVSSSGSFTNYLNPGSATLSPIYVDGLALFMFPLYQTITTQPSILNYRWNASAYPSGTSEIFYTNNLQLEKRLNAHSNLDGSLRPQTLSSTGQWILGDDSSWWHMHCVSGTMYVSLS